MPTRLKRPSVLKQLSITAVLLAFLGYLGSSAIGGQFGFESKQAMVLKITELGGESATLQAEIDVLRHRISLFDPARLDPDILTEQARKLLSMAHPGDVILIDLH